MTKFFLKSILFSIPFLILFSLAFWIDPYKVFHKLPSTQFSYIFPPNERFLKINYLKSAPKNSVNSFIMGSSIGHAYHTDYLNNAFNDGSQFYNLCVFGESLLGIEKKLDFLINQSYPLKRIIFVLDTSIISKTTPREGLIFRDPPDISDESIFSFYVRYLTLFFNPFAIKDYIRYSNRNMNFLLNLDSGDNLYISWENEILAAPKTYYEKNRALFPQNQTDQTMNPPVIKPIQMHILNHIKDMLTANKIESIALISPVFNRQKISNEDLSKIKLIFDHVYDYSGTNLFSVDMNNFYDESHYRPLAASKILDQVIANLKSKK